MGYRLRKLAAVVGGLVLIGSVTACTPDELGLWYSAHLSVHNQPWLVCIRSVESDTAGGYSAIGGGGKYRGAYQYDATTWNSASVATGRGWLANGDASSATVHDQDVVTWDYARMTNGSPWAGDFGRCGRP